MVGVQYLIYYRAEELPIDQIPRKPRGHFFAKGIKALVRGIVSLRSPMVLFSVDWS